MSLFTASMSSAIEFVVSTTNTTSTGPAGRPSSKIRRISTGTSSGACDSTVVPPVADDSFAHASTRTWTDACTGTTTASGTAGPRATHAVASHDAASKITTRFTIHLR